jgi:hypothetical protein
MASTDTLLNDDVRKALVDGVCPYVLTGCFRAEREASERTWDMLMERVKSKEKQEEHEND